MMSHLRSSLDATPIKMSAIILEETKSHCRSWPSMQRSTDEKEDLEGMEQSTSHDQPRGEAQRLGT